MENNYKAKYEEIKAKWMSSVDAAFRLGYEQGAKEAQMNQMMEQQQQQAELAAAQVGAPQGQPGKDAQPGQEPQPGEEQPQEPDSQHPDGSELDQHIAQLEGMLGKGEVSVTDLNKTLNDLKSLQKSYKGQLELRKSAQAVKGIIKALHKPEFKISQQANHNMSKNAKESVNMQQKIVQDIFKSWADQEKKASKDILSTLNVEGLIQGE